MNAARGATEQSCRAGHEQVENSYFGVTRPPLTRPGSLCSGTVVQLLNSRRRQKDKRLMVRVRVGHPFAFMVLSGDALSLASASER